MMTLLSTIACLLFLANTASACVGYAGLHDHFLPLKGTLAVEQEIPLNAAGYGMSDLGQGAYMITDGIYQTFVLLSTAGVVVVDAPPTIGRNIEYAIGNLTNVPVKWVVYSHMHADHIGAAYLFTNNPCVVTIAQENTAWQLNFTPDPRRPPLAITFKDNYTLVAGNQTLELFFPGPGHDMGNIIIYALKQKILMMVDQVFPGYVPFEYLAEAIYVPGWIKAHDQLLAYDFDVYLGGHMGGPANRTAVELQREYVQDLYDNCFAAIQKSGTDDPAVGLGVIAPIVLQNNVGNSWAEFGVYLDAISELCYNVTSEKWLGKPAGQDIFGYSHAKAMINSLRFDLDVLGPTGVQP
ncbi:Metallo-hydrolase/oxidoreductase [Coniochaeta ligniaria NRRL 30616]|uniref:Metallo-hydrolase/oxidoreductase n=1 Tax=Coniochaeta ligniaria NRRL 30616 TaxID=1408157 RepID=A0A1J7IRR1_9PEZI|nr:Metallo-hydrolase/oxidoreductase [Coniochaeta ligniaria NRRL 30616]